MVKKLKLDYIPDYDFLLLGIVSYDKDYRLSWEISQKMFLDFVRVDDHVVKYKKTGMDQHFSCFEFEDENTWLHYKLLSNRSDTGNLLEELKNLDYLLVVSGEYFGDHARELRDRLLALQSVQSCFIINPEEIRDVERVL